MLIEIRKYDPERDYEKLLNVIKSEGEEWGDYLKPVYQDSLKQTITYVSYANGELCGYIRSINDSGLYIWVVDLLVDQNFRGHSIGKQLLNRVATDHPGQDTYVMSDVDEYYEKQGFEKEGSIFKIS